MKNTATNHTRIAFALGLERELLKPKDIQSIPPATRSYWRRQKPERYEVGLTKAQRKGLVSEVQAAERQRMARFVRRVVRAARRLEEQVGRRAYLEFMDELTGDFARFFEEEDRRPSQGRVLALFGVPQNRYAYNLAKLETPCESSPQSLCARRFPGQVSPEELARLRDAVNDPSRRHWPTSSIWARGVRNHDFGMGRSTAYRYIRRFGLRPARQLAKPPKPEGIRATRPNQIWHGDISHVKLEDGTTSYLYAIKDNHSKQVVAHRVERNVSALHALACLKSALARYPDAAPRIITDGGSEYDNQLMAEFLRSCRRKLVHDVAKRDIRHSNSMVERLFLTLKSETLHGQRLVNHDHLVQIAATAIAEYNARPHSAHLLYSPDEVQAGDTHFDFPAAKARAFKARLECNRNSPCTRCTCKAP